MGTCHGTSSYLKAVGVMIMSGVCIVFWCYIKGSDFNLSQRQEQATSMILGQGRLGFDQETNAKMITSTKMLPEYRTP